MCHKRKFDKIGAAIALSTIKGRNRLNNDWNRRELRMYYCKECDAWHLTSWSRPNKKLTKYKDQ